MKKINILLAVSFLGGNLLSLANNSAPTKQKLMATRSVNIETYTTKKKNNVKYEITIAADSKKTFSNKLLIKLSDGVAFDASMTSLTINQNLALSRYYEFLLADCQIDGNINGNEISTTEFTALEYMHSIIAEESIKYSTNATKMAATFNLYDAFMHSERLIEGVSYPQNYNFPTNFANGYSYGYVALVGSGYYKTVTSTKKTYNIFGGLKSSDTNTYKIYFIETSYITMATQDGKVLRS